MTAKNIKLFTMFAILIALLISGLTLALQQAQGAPQTMTEPTGHGDIYTFDIQASIPPGYRTGLWPTYPPTDTLTNTNLLLESEAHVTMVDDWKATIVFTTTSATPAVRVHYGVYEPDPLLPRPRFHNSTKENLVGISMQHSVEIDIGKLLGGADVNEMEANGGGLVVYRLEIRHPEDAVVRFYDRRFEFYNGQVVPTVSEGPFVDQITESSAIVSWDTDLPVDGIVRLEGVGDFYAPNSNDTHFEVPLTGLSAGRTYTYSVQITDGISTTTTRQYSFRTPAQDTTQFAFAVMGNSRAGYGGGEYDSNGVNARVLGSLATGAFNRGAEFIVHTGDLVNGHTTSVSDFEMQLDSFKDAVENIGHYIPIYELMGDHEAVTDIFSDTVIGPMFDKEGSNSAEVIFTNEFVNPTNGPDPDNVAANTPPGKSLPPYEENVYYFDYGNSRFVMMNNNYWYSSHPEQYGGNLEGYVLDDQTAWLTQVFSQTKADASIDHVFLFAQEPPFPTGGHSSDGMWHSGGDPAQNDGWDRTYVVERRDEIWQAFVDTGKAVAGTFGDESNYSRTYITTSVAISGSFEHPAWQIVSGGAGAPLSIQEPGLPWSDDVKEFTTQMHYTLLKVNGQEVRLEVYNINDRLIESVLLKTSGGIISPDVPHVEPMEIAPRFSPSAIRQMALTSPVSDIELATPEDVPAGYETGLWPTYPITYPLITDTNLLLVEGPHVTMVNTRTAQITFTTAISTPAAVIYYGVYEPDPLLPWPRFHSLAQESLVGNSTQHSVEIDIDALLGDADVNGMEAKGGGLIVYRIEVYDPETATARFYDRRFEFNNDQVVPTVIEGPFVDQVAENSAIVSWDTDLPVTGTVQVEGVGNFAASNSNDTHFEVALTGLAAGNTYTYSIQITDGINTITTRQYAFRTPAQDTTQFAFAVMGNSRAGYGGGEYDFNGVNARVMGSLATGAFNQGAEFIVHTGDLVNGHTTSVPDFEMQIESFKDAVENVGHYIPIYELVGDHEAVTNIYSDTVGGQSYIFDKEGSESAETVFANEFVNPSNGPDPDNVVANTPPGKSLPPYKESVYYFDYGNSRFVMMNNNYWYSSHPEQYGGNLEGYVLDDQMAWLTEVFSQTKADDSIDHIFLFAQEPLFPTGGHSADGMWHSSGDPAQNDGWDRTYVVERRDEIWRAFVGTGKAVAGSFGDESNYSRTFITQNQDGQSFTRPVWQIVSGGAGAPFSIQETGLPWSDDVKKFSTQLHYVLFKVDGDTVTLETYNIDGELIENIELTPIGYTIYLPLVIRNYP